MCLKLYVLFLDVKMRATTNISNQNSNVTPYKDYPGSNSSSTKSQTQLVSLKTKYIFKKRTFLNMLLF